MIEVKKQIKFLIRNIISILLSLIVLTPFFMIILNSMKTHREANKLQLNFIGISFKQILENYYRVFALTNLSKGFFNSFVVTSISALAVIITASMAGFVISRRKTKVLKILNMIIISGLTLPLATVPIFFILNKIGLINTYIGAILVYTAGNFAFAYFLFVGYYKTLSAEIDEAAIIDGANPLVLFFKIIFPLLKPATVTVLITQIMSIWNDFNISIYLLNSPAKRTAVLSTYSFIGQKASEWNLLFADVVVVSLPVVIIYLCLQKHIVSGLTAGALKG
jgi:raffinose/stachyose/melibiose transport system permease protein